MAFFSCYAQNTGYAGKKCILKTDVFYGRFLGFKNIEAEYVFSPQWSITAGVRFHKGAYKQDFTENDKDYIMDGRGISSYSSNFSSIKSLPKVTMSFIAYKLMARRYFNRVSPKAPRGWYFGMLYESGTAKLTGATQVVPIISGTGFTKQVNFIVMPNATINNVNISIAELSIGHQEILKNRIMVDFNLALCFSRFNGNGTKKTLEVTTLSGNRMGPNIVNFPKDDEYYGLVNHDAPFQTAVGLSAYIKIGYLIF